MTEARKLEEKKIGDDFSRGTKKTGWYGCGRSRGRGFGNGRSDDVDKRQQKVEKSKIK